MRTWARCTIAANAIVDVRASKRKVILSRDRIPGECEGISARKIDSRLAFVRPFQKWARSPWPRGDANLQTAPTSSPTRSATPSADDQIKVDATPNEKDELGPHRAGAGTGHLRDDLPNRECGPEARRPHPAVRSHASTAGSVPPELCPRRLCAGLHFRPSHFTPQNGRRDEICGRRHRFDGDRAGRPGVSCPPPPSSPPSTASRLSIRRSWP